jgi:hypothetical protein
VKYSFLEFDEQEVAKLGKRHCWPPVKIGDVFENGFHAGAFAQHSKDSAIFKQLIEIIEMQNEALKLIALKDVYVGENGWRDEYFLSVKQADEALAAVENKLKELEK